MLFPILLVFLGGYALARAGVLSSAPLVGSESYVRALPAPRQARLTERSADLREVREVRPRVYASTEPACPPSPMAVMTELLELGRTVPPFVVQCAIAEAELAGQYQVAYALTQQFVLPGLRDAAPAPSDAAARAFAAPASAPAPAPVTSEDAALEAEALGQPAVQAPQASPQGADLGPPPLEASPISGVADTAWSEMLARLVRESPAADTGKHVGRYRHHKSRLAEVGFDPTIVGGDPRLQDAAMSTDLADCFRHLRASGTLDQALGRPITVPGHPGAVPATLSGVLGVCSVAGLERAVSWMDHEEDRAAYPHTTMAFIRTNGVF